MTARSTAQISKKTSVFYQWDKTVSFIFPLKHPGRSSIDSCKMINNPINKTFNIRQFFLPG